MAAAKRPLTLDELGEVVSIEPCQPSYMPERLINDTHGIVRWCHGLVALHDLDDALHFTHSSVREFFCSPDTNRVKLQGFHFRPNEADRGFGEVCVTYLNFNDFKTQLVKPPKRQELLGLDPMMVASHTLRSGSPGIAFDRARDLMRKRSKSTSATSKLLFPHVGDRASYAITNKYWLHRYASEFWLSHTSELSPEQGHLWNLFRMLAEQRYPAHLNTRIVVPEAGMDGRGRTLCDYIYSHQHQALFRRCMAERWTESALPLVLAEALGRKCFSFVKLLPPLAQYHGLSWQQALLSLDQSDLIETLPLAGTQWYEELTVSERSKLFVVTLGSDGIVSRQLIRDGIDPYYRCEFQGESQILLKMLIRGMHSSLLSDVCEAMLASNMSFERKIAHPGRTVLHCAADAGGEAIATLLEHGALVNAFDDHGQTALHIATSAARHEAMKILLKYSAPVNATDDHGQTALHIAVQGCTYHFAIVEELLKAGASLNIEDRFGKVASDYITGDVKDHLLEAAHRRAK